MKINRNQCMLGTLLLMAQMLLAVNVWAKDVYSISVTIKGMSDRKFYMGYYYGDKQYLRDSAISDRTGKFVFHGDKELEGGVYIVASAEKSLLFDFIVTEQQFTLETDTLDMIGHMQVKNSPENTAFFEYSKYSAGLGARAGDLESKMKMAKAKNDAEAEKKYTKELDGLQDEVVGYRKEFSKKYPNMLTTKIFKMMEELDIPEPPKKADGTIDSTWQYYWYLDHYFDHFDLKDERISRTPVFFPRFEKYITKIIPQIPDTVNRYVDLFLKRSESAKETFKFGVFWITSYYEESKYMGMDAIFVHMVDEYYAKGRAWWVDSTLNFKLKDRANRLRYNLLGRKALNLSLPDTNNVYHSLFNVNANYTLLAFWDATCGHCKEEMPKILHIYDSINAVHSKAPAVKTKFFEVYGVSSTPDAKDWRKYIYENKHPWINVYDPNNESNFRYFYDIYSTPVLYLLNDKKEIIAKRLSPEQIVDLIQNTERKKMKK